MAVITIPDPSLIVLVGAACSGKTTFAARHFDPSEVLSSDSFRALISGDEGNQSATRAAFGRLHRDLTRRLHEGRLTVVDATNVERSARRALIARSRIAGVPAIAIVLDLSAAVVLARNAARTARVVDDTAVHLHLARLRATLDGPNGDLNLEGFREVHLFRQPSDVDEVRIQRVPADTTFTKR